ncbi:MAG: MFS transporter [Firmicutes bacterium]|nr:MFS transporter [Bacillota bacterium]
MGKIENRDLAAFSILHFLVDFGCIFLLTAFLLPLMADRFTWVCCLVTYNLFAFALQLPAGAFGDLYGRPKKLAAAGCLLIALAYGVIGMLLLAEPALQNAGGDLVSVSGTAAGGAGAASSPVPLFAAAVIAGAGNAFFHVGGGIDTLKNSGGLAGRPGLFVSTGAFGVWLGPVLASRNMGIAIGMTAGILPMLAGGILMILLERADRRLPETIPEPDTEAAAEFPQIKNTKSRHGIAVLAVSCLFLTVVIRSYAGGLTGFSWKAVPLLAFLFIAGVAGGKMAGGFLGDRIGWMRSAAGSLLLSLLLFAAAANHPACGILGIFFFNMTMPVTLTAIAEIAGPDHEGAAFGLTTFALFLGTLPSSVNILTKTDLSPAWMLGPSIVMSVLLICAGLSHPKLKRCRDSGRG